MAKKRQSMVPTCQPVEKYTEGHASKHLLLCLLVILVLLRPFLIWPEHNRHRKREDKGLNLPFVKASRDLQPTSVLFLGSQITV